MLHRFGGGTRRRFIRALLPPSNRSIAAGERFMPVIIFQQNFILSHARSVGRRSSALIAQLLFTLAPVLRRDQRYRDRR